ncbi:hypothetical protein [Spirillospora sp. NPDC048819]|uniref:hypothetical protein n=1 Tax=Spirillospora sp. NPDC048819 TaxID=3155268 RepID=UPI0033F3F2B8
MAQWLQRWLDDHQGAPSTVTGYADHVRRYLTPLLGHLLLAEVAVAHVEENPASLVALPPTRRPRAVVWTAARVQHWRKTGERPAVAVWTAAQTAQFLDAIAAHRLYAAYYLIALRGLRRGEAAGLRGVMSTWTREPR